MLSPLLKVSPDLHANVRTLTYSQFPRQGPRRFPELSARDKIQTYTSIMEEARSRSGLGAFLLQKIIKMALLFQTRSNGLDRRAARRMLQNDVFILE